MSRCPACGKQFEKPIGAPPLEVMCPQCAEPRGEAGAYESVKQSGGTDTLARPLVTLILIGINVLVFVLMGVRGVSLMEPKADQVLSFGANFGPLTLGGQWWRLFTCMFVHFGILHIALNMWCLWSLGQLAERLMGRLAFLIAYIASGLFAGVASLLWNPMRVSAGASGAIFGIAGALVTFLYLKKAPIALPEIKKKLGSLGSFVVYNLFYGAVGSRIDNSAHLGGLVMGLAVGALLPTAIRSGAGAAGITETAAVPPGLPAITEHSPGPGRRMRLVVAVVGAAVLIVGTIRLTLRVQATALEIGVAETMIDSGQGARAIPILQKIIAREPDRAVAYYLLGTAYLETGNAAAGLAPLIKAVGLDPQNVNFRHNLAADNLSLGNYEPAIRGFQSVLPAEPNDPHVHYGLGLAFLGEGRFAEAIAELKQAAALAPESANTQDFLGQAYSLAGRFDDARATYQRVLDKFPGDERAKIGIQMAQGKPSQSQQPKGPAKPAPTSRDSKDVPRAPGTDPSAKPNQR